MVTFSSRHDGNDVRYIFDDVPVAEIGTVDMEQYVPDGGTPLYDAMGTALARLETQCGKDDMVLVTIITDGMENSSHEFSGKSIKIPFLTRLPLHMARMMVSGSVLPPHIQKNANVRY